MWAGLEDSVIELPRRLATAAELHRVHPPAYLAWLERLCADGGGQIDHDTAASPGSWDTALDSAGCGLAVIEALQRGDGDAGLVLARPPGHHATAEQAMGFCLLNNIAVAAAALIDAGERVAILDWDVHHGNGTQDLFWEDGRVLYASTHEWGIYPGTGAPDEIGARDGRGLTMNVPLPAGSGGPAVIAAFERVFAPAIESFEPSWLLISAGFDGHRDDPLADLLLTSGDYAALATLVRSWAPQPGRVVAFLEGGYDLDALTRSVGGVAAALIGRQADTEPRSTGTIGLADVEAVESFWHRLRADT